MEIEDQLSDVVTQPMADQFPIRAKKYKSPWQLIKELDKNQRLTFAAAFLGWSLDAFDYFIVSMTAASIAKDFGVEVSDVTSAITFTLMLRPVGALIFGALADRFGRKWPLMVDILLYSAIELASGFAPNLTTFVVLRAFFGVAMGGEWGLGSSLAMESLPAEARGLFSGILQQGYATGYLLAALFNYAIVTGIGASWRVVFYVASFPAVLIIFIRAFVPESDTFERTKAFREREGRTYWDEVKKVFKNYYGRIIYAIILMAFFNFMSHGSQDLYPAFLQKQMHYSSADVTITAVIYNIGAILGGTIVGYYSEHWGRRRAIVVCAILGGCFIALWAFGPNMDSLRLGAFVLQFFVQGAWGVIPAHLNELSPPEFRGTFPGLCYQIGNLISSASAQIEAVLGEKFPVVDSNQNLVFDSKEKPIPNYALTQAIFMAIAFFGVIVMTLMGKEHKGKDFTDHLESAEKEAEIFESVIEEYNIKDVQGVESENEY
ncbi:major facilitator superfamily domain-containing protein [Jimgerdemannia flammicorona]|uniref:Major facilitator superfamily domain-containing protein n=1 Tax=Jimgerdemannia flammicorona TaxID=994334 RepID=A0A433CVU0_9FUNG|nr:major facilitator superfamily domain-containing protein [Jimgerdemannia flammicorona]